MSVSANAPRARRGTADTASGPARMITKRHSGEDEPSKKHDPLTTAAPFRPGKIAMVVLIVTSMAGFLLHQRLKKSYYKNANVQPQSHFVSVQSAADLERESARSIKALKVPFPIFVASFSKSGTTSTYHAFACYLGHEHVAHRWTTSSLNKNGAPEFIGRCIQQNIQRQKPPLEGCGTNPLNNQTKTVVWTDTGYAGSKSGCYHPNLQALDDIWDAYPRGTLMLVRRNATAWFHSANSKRAGFIKIWSKACSGNNNSNNSIISMPNTTNESDWVHFYNSHVQQIRSFAASRKPRGLTYVEVGLENPDTGKILEVSVGLPESCWKHCLSSFTQEKCKDLPKKKEEND